MPSTSVRLTWAETRRKLAHMAAFWPALFLPWMTPGQALGVTFLLLLMNLFILPWAAKGLYRAEESGMGALEIVLYPAALTACVIAFGFDPGNAGGNPGADSGGGAAGLHAWYLPLGAAWFALACVDACIGFACRILPGGPALPWNRRKPILGVALGTLASLLPAYALARLALPALSGTEWAVLIVLVLIAAAAETAWFGVADNLVIPFFLCVSIPLFAAPLFAAPLFADNGAADQSWAQGMFTGSERLGRFSLLAPVAFGLLAWMFRLLTPGGAVLGGMLALFLILAEPWLFLFLGGFFALGNIATRVGFARKQARGIAEARGGKRGAAEVFGAMGMTAWMTPLVHLAHMPHLAKSGIVETPADGYFHRALLVCIAPLVAKTMDTVSSEIGKAVGGKTVSLRSFRLVAPGTDGGVSLAGTLCGLAAAAVMALAILPLGWGSLSDVAALLGIAVLANLFESYWGEYATKRGMDQGPHTNVLMTLAAAVLAWLYFFR